MRVLTAVVVVLVMLFGVGCGGESPEKGTPMETSRETMQEDSVTVEETMTPREATEVTTGFEFEVDRSPMDEESPEGAVGGQSTNDVWPRLSSLISPLLLELPSTGADRSAPFG